jgi:hypothetical protein
MVCEWCLLVLTLWVRTLTCCCSCENMVLWRGHFDGTGRETSVNLSINGGEGVNNHIMRRLLLIFMRSLRCNRVAERCLLEDNLWKVRTGHKESISVLIFSFSSTNNENIISETDEEYGFPSSSVRVGKDNVITVLLDNMGLDESEGKCLPQVACAQNSIPAPDHPDTSKSPRGIRGFYLNGGSNVTWKVQGKVGGYTEYANPHIYEYSLSNLV